MTHELKISPENFENVLNGSKTFEIRRTDRNFQPRDVLVLREYDGESYTGRQVMADVLLVLNNEYCKDGYCVMSIYVRGMNYIQGVPIILCEDEPKAQTDKLNELRRLFDRNAESVCGDEMITVEEAMNCVYRWLELM